MARFHSSWNGVLDPGMDPDSIPTVPFGLLTSLSLRVQCLSNVWSFFQSRLMRLSKGVDGFPVKAFQPMTMISITLNIAPYFN